MIEKQTEREILLVALATPDYGLIEFFQKMQKKLGMSPAVFCQMMDGACEYYLTKLSDRDSFHNSNLPETFLGEPTRVSTLLPLFGEALQIGRDFGQGIDFGEAEILQMQEIIRKAFEEAENPGKEESVIAEKPLPAKLILLWLYRIDEKLDRKKHTNKVHRNKLLNHELTSLVNDYRQLEYFINVDSRLKEGEIRTFENYLEQLQDPEIIKKLKELKLT